MRPWVGIVAKGRLRSGVLLWTAISAWWMCGYFVNVTTIGQLSRTGKDARTRLTRGYLWSGHGTIFFRGACMIYSGGSIVAGSNLFDAGWCRDGGEAGAPHLNGVLGFGWHRYARVRTTPSAFYIGAPLPSYEGVVEAQVPVWAIWASGLLWVFYLAWRKGALNGASVTGFEVEGIKRDRSWYRSNSEAKEPKL